MDLKSLVRIASDKTNFATLDAYVTFARHYLDLVADKDNYQALIVSQNENKYRFYQYKADGHYSVTRPINSELLIPADRSGSLDGPFLAAVDNAGGSTAADAGARALICNGIYTLQQCIGATLDALPVGESNKARKINGDLFERLILLLIQRLGVDCAAGNVKIKIDIPGGEPFTMSYQHDLIVKEGNAIKAIGGVKTSSKDRIDKVFIDKFLYQRLTGQDTPHVAIFLNDVQRKASPLPNRYGVSATFLPGKFKGYTIKLNPLDGVYYCDVRPNMTTDPLLAQHIRTIDHFFCADLWNFVSQPGAVAAEIVAQNP